MTTPHNPDLPKSESADQPSPSAAGSEKPRREDVAWQLETALKELSYGNILNVMVHTQRAAAMALEIFEARRGSPNAAGERPADTAHPTTPKTL